MAYEKTKAMIVVVVAAVLGLVGFWVAKDAVQASGLSIASLSRWADYAGAAVVIGLLGAATGSWCRRISWVFLGLAALIILMDIQGFVSSGFWSNMGSASAAAVAVWVISFGSGIALGRFARARSSR